MQILRLQPQDGDSEGQGIPGLRWPWGSDQLGVNMTQEDQGQHLLHLYSWQVVHWDLFLSQH